MRLPVITDGRVVRSRRARPGRRQPKALWVVHLDTCEFAPGCTPFADLVREMSEIGVLNRIRVGQIVRCRSCAPILVGELRTY